MELTLVVKGKWLSDVYERIREHIPKALVSETPTESHGSWIVRCTVSDLDLGIWEALGNWMVENNNEIPFPEGSLLWYRFD